MRFNFLHIVLILCSCVKMSGQSRGRLITGKVSYLTSKNVYVRFDSTEALKKGDTLRFVNQETPCLLIIQKSSHSAVCTPLNKAILKKGDVVFLYFKEESSLKPNSVIPAKDSILQKPAAPEKAKPETVLTGRASVSSYSMLSDTREDRHRLMYRLSLNADRIFNSNLSFETYLTYRQNLNEIPNYNNIFNVYNLALGYAINSGFHIYLGRRINNKMSSLGAIDGLQIDKYFGKTNIGAIVGFRPDIFDYGFNTDLFQYGAYVGRKTNTKKIFSETTLGYIEQRNKQEIDRRYIYLQHTSNLFRKLNLFASTEIDLYKKVGDTVSNVFQLTNLYVSARYRFSRKWDVSVSYDTRKRILYYETFKTEIERLLDDDLARQGLRFRINVRPFNQIMLGASYSKRFQSDQQNKSDNIFAYVNFRKLPVIGGSLRFNYNNNKSNYLTSQVGSVNYSTYFFDYKLNTTMYFRYAYFEYFAQNNTLQQNYYGLNVSYNITRKLLVSISGEYSNNTTENNYRIYAKIIKRF